MKGNTEPITRGIQRLEDAEALLWVITSSTTIFAVIRKLYPWFSTVR
jgi:hypothetical protein